MSALKKYKEEANRLRAELASARAEMAIFEAREKLFIEYKEQLMAILMSQDNRTAFMDVMAHVNVRCAALLPSEGWAFEVAERELRARYGYIFPFRPEDS